MVRLQPEHNRPRKEDMAEKERIRKNTDSEFWFCLCFKTEAEKARFQTIIGSDKETLSGIEIRELCANLKPERVKKSFKRPQAYPAHKDPLADVEYSGFLMLDEYAELQALKKAFEHPGKAKHITESKHYIRVFFANRADKFEFLKEWNLSKYGDKYLDGSTWLKECM